MKQAKQAYQNGLKVLGAGAAAGTALYALGRLAQQASRKAVGALTRSFTRRLLTDNYEENLWELVHATARITPQTVVETSLRAQTGTVISRPLGSRRKFYELDDIFFDFAQLARGARPANLRVDTAVVIGPQAKRPMRLEIPIMIAGMAWSLALSRDAKIALARASRLAGTSTNSGEGIPAPGEIEEAGKYVLQIGRSCWNRQESLIKRADMIEIQLGQGASGSTGHPVEYTQLEPGSQRAYGLRRKNEAIQLYTRLPEVAHPADIGKMVQRLRDLTDVPIGVKIGAGKYLEEDLDIILNAGFDAIWLDGAQAGSHAAAPILMDDCGLPTFYAICRAADYLKKQGVKEKVSLIAAGGLFCPGDFLKCMALGANAVGIGTLALLGISHQDIVKVLPWEPPTQLVFATGNRLGAFNIDKGATGLYHLLMSCVDEMVLGARALGRESLSAVDRSDLMSIDPRIAQTAGIDYCGDPQPLGKAAASQPQWLQREHALAHIAAIDRAEAHSQCGSLMTP